jgi:hypothetical protein
MANEDNGIVRRGTFVNGMYQNPFDDLNNRAAYDAEVAQRWSDIQNHTGAYQTSDQNWFEKIMEPVMDFTIKYGPYIFAAAAGGQALGLFGAGEAAAGGLGAAEAGTAAATGIGETALGGAGALGAGEATLGGMAGLEGAGAAAGGLEGMMGAAGAGGLGAAMPVVTIGAPAAAAGGMGLGGLAALGAAGLGGTALLGAGGEASGAGGAATEGGFTPDEVAAAGVGGAGVGGAAAAGAGAAGGAAAGGLGSALGGAAGAAGAGGLGAALGGLGGLTGLLNGLGGLLGGNVDRIQSQQDADWWESQLKELQGMYKPGTPEAELMRHQMEAKDAAAGRNSQYGIRETDLAAKLAEKRSGIITSGGYQNMANAYRNRSSQDLNGLFGAMGQQGGLGSMISNGIDGFKTIAGLFGGSDKPGINVMPPTR